MGRRSISWAKAGVACLVAWTGSAALASSGSLDQSFLQPMGPIAQEQYDHLLRVIGITMVVILPVLIGVPLILWRYRYSRPRGAYTPEWEFSKKLEYALWGVPVLVVILLASWLWYSTEKLDPYEPLGPEPLQVQAIGLDWKWLFIYPEEGIATVDELAVPVGRPVELTLTTDTVMQSLLIAPLTGQIYAMPGMTTKLNFSATRTGEAEGENTQFNGDGFGRQKFTVRALAPADYEAWVASSKDGLALDEETYATLRRRTVLADARGDLGLNKRAQPIIMALGQQDIFQQIVAKYHGSGNTAASERWGGIALPQSGAKGAGE
ncbi:cytochrome c oxidase subunit II [Altericroceibacterium endophyticum]|uniref:Cytochrome ubiquinol oxidase subunit II n=1 Tax=Altericroceibacterium endophyticum TaxID=1808508 RepID=A0A6I4TAW6_9SPHN|nr:cytochrome ubiquinol oxidase subunit II [Altericroceibacterium endophyticum]MXO67010.1 cytochrome ubiquinol oxidase subunit II [Altericroceibacterium endophyticum]